MWQRRDRHCHHPQSAVFVDRVADQERPDRAMPDLAGPMVQIEQRLAELRVNAEACVNLPGRFEEFLATTSRLCSPEQITKLVEDELGVRDLVRLRAGGGIVTHAHPPRV